MNPTITILTVAVALTASTSTIKSLILNVGTSPRMQPLIPRVKLCMHPQTQPPEGARGKKMPCIGSQGE